MAASGGIVVLFLFYAICRRMSPHILCRRTLRDKPLVMITVVIICTPIGVTRSQSREALQPVTVAFIDDQGMNSNSKAVLQLIKAEGADLVLHQGDLDYRDNPAIWGAFITIVLGAHFPYLASVGNHDWLWHYPDGYRNKSTARSPTNSRWSAK